MAAAGVLNPPLDPFTDQAAQMPAGARGPVVPSAPCASRPEGCHFAAGVVRQG